MTWPFVYFIRNVYALPCLLTCALAPLIVSIARPVKAHFPIENLFIYASLQNKRRFGLAEIPRPGRMPVSIPQIDTVHRIVTWRTLILIGDLGHIREGYPATAQAAG